MSAPEHCFIVTLTWTTGVTDVVAVFKTLSGAIRHTHVVLRAEMKRKPRTVIINSDGTTWWFKGTRGRFYLSIIEQELRDDRPKS